MGSVSLGRVAVAKLKIDHALYQREFRPWKKGTEFNELLYEVIEVSRRGPGNDNDYVVRGQRRVELARQSGVKHLQARIHTGLSLQEEAMMYALDARDRVRMRPLELFKGEIAWGEETAVEIEKAAQAAGFVIGNLGRTAAGPHIEAIVALKQVARQNGIDNLRLTLNTLAKWSGGTLGLEARTGEFIRAFAFYLKTHPNIKATQLDRLFKTPPELIYLRAKQARGRGSTAAASMRDELIRLLNRAAGTKQPKPKDPAPAREELHGKFAKRTSRVPMPELDVGLRTR